MIWIHKYFNTVGSNTNETIHHINRAQPDWAYEFPDRTVPDTNLPDRS